MKRAEFSELEGQMITSLEVHRDERIDFTTRDGGTFAMYHQQDCCEHVALEEVIGDLHGTLVGAVVVKAECVENADAEPIGSPDLHEWTFYHLRTARGDVTLRWYGTSNGYYSVDVGFWRTA